MQRLLDETTRCQRWPTLLNDSERSETEQQVMQPLSYSDAGGVCGDSNGQSSYPGIESSSG